jgi:sarcosine oxidase
VRLGIVGLGSVGALAAWLAARSGHEVVGFEAGALVHRNGGYAGESRLFRTAYHEGARYVPLLTRARELWVQLAAAADREILLETGTLTIAPEGSATLAGVFASIESFALPHRVLDARQLVQDYPAHRVMPDDVGVLDVLGGALRPEVAVWAALELARAEGARVHSHRPVVAIEHTSKGVRLVDRAGDGTLVDNVIVAAGAWTGDLLPELSRHLEIRPLVLTWYLPARPELYRPSRFPAFIRDRGETHVFGAPTLDGWSVKVSATDIWDAVPHPSATPAGVTEERIAAFSAQVVELLPGLHPEPARVSIHRDAYTAARTPIVDLVRPGVVAVAGLSGHGFKLAPVFAELAIGMSRGTHDPAGAGFALPSTT